MIRLFLILISFFPIVLMGQVKITKFYYDKNWITCDSLSAKYFSIHSYNDTIKKNGTIEKYLITGQLYSSEKYSNIDSLIKNGESKLYHTNGHLKAQRNFLKGRIDGELVTYYSNGQLKRKDYFERGIFKNGNCYTSDGRDTTHFDYEILPRYPGGPSEVAKFISKKVNYDLIIDRTVHGKVMIKFDIDENGKSSNFKIVKSIDPVLDEEALRVVRLLNRWSPKLDDGESVISTINIPIVF